ncbi:MAG: class I SAM-dependent RNA methyltransferase [Treponema sp.]|nr:class I SAM-dependent RNA methyltransferase [Treponema sp.]
MQTLVALCAIGTEKILTNEIKLLGFKTCGNAPGRVYFTCKKVMDMYRANLCLRTADRIYLQLTKFNAEDFEALFDGVYSIEWQELLKKDVRIIVDKVRTYKSKLSSEHSIQSIVHKAIYKKLGALWNMSVLPETGSPFSVRVYIEENVAKVLLDLSGEPLNRRGYRTHGGSAPIRETLAASLIQLMYWKRKLPLHDPFCGSGTIAIEAALYAYNVAPGFGRHFALENLIFFDETIAREIRFAEAEKIRPDAVARITGTDIDLQAIERARINAEHACVTAGRALQSIGSDSRIQRPDFEVADFASICAPYEEGMLIGNPPYGERLGDSTEAEDLYGRMKCFLTGFPKWQMGFITSNEKFENFFGKKADRKKNLKCGNLDTCFYMYGGK